MHRYLLIFFMALFGFLTPLFSIHAEGIGISVEPFLSDLVLDEDETEKPFTVTLFNASSNEVRLDASAVDFGSLDASAGVAFLGASRDIEKTYLAADWIKLEADSVTIPPNEVRELKGKLVNTSNLSPGGHYGSILFRMKGSDMLAMGPASIALDQRLSALVFLKKRGGERYGMDLMSFSRKRDSFGSVRSAEFVFKNTGNVHVAPRGVVELFDPRGRLIAKGIINEGSLLILPTTDRSFPISLYPVETAWLPGKYLLRSSYRYDGKVEYETREDALFVFPPRFVAFASVCLAVIIGILIYRKKRKKNKGAV